MKRIIRCEEELKERIKRSRKRISEISEEKEGREAVRRFFKKEGDLLLLLFSLADAVSDGSFDRLSEEELKRLNGRLYADLEMSAYETSYVNPTFAVKELSMTVGRELSHLAHLIGNAAGYIFSGRWIDFIKIAELFIEMHDILKKGEGEEAVRFALSSFMKEHTEEKLTEDIRVAFTAAETNNYRLLTEEEESPGLLYRFGLYVGPEEERVSKFLASLPEEEITKMARTHVNGFFDGFQTMNMDITEKKSIKLIYPLGFERVAREEVRQFEERGLKCFISIVNEGINKQADYDHKKDEALYLDETYMQRYLEAYEKGFSFIREEVKGFAGVALIETFGENEFSPVKKREASAFDEKGRKLFTALSGKRSQIVNKYAPSDKRSFSIISYPIPAISEDRFEEIFRDIIKINNMDSERYRTIQQHLIDALDEGEYVIVKGIEGNETDMKVMLHPLTNPEKETNFENCVADVNIPVGEVFTSPVLTGTEGVLHVSRVYLKGLLYKNLKLRFKDGMVTDYSCENFAVKEENGTFIRETLLAEHDSIPLGEFAIGTNTLAYVTGIKYDIAGKLPILIAEKTGPHFAVGDTCYAMQEEHSLFNPDGKEIIARENEYSAKRKTDIDKAYFNCHTDITLPYNELSEISAVKKDGTKTELIKNGRFVLPGTEELNEALAELV